MQSIRWSAAPAKPKVELSVVPGTTYKLQLPFAEQCCSGRGFDVLAEAHLLVDEFSPATTQGGAGNTSAGAVISAEFIGGRATADDAHRSSVRKSEPRDLGCYQQTGAHFAGANTSTRTCESACGE